MPTTDVLINREYKVLLLRDEGTSGSFPGFEAFGKYSHGTPRDPEGWIGNHTDYDHLRELLYQAGEWWPCDYMIMRSRSGGTPIAPLVPGPMDFVIDSRREASGSVPFQMAYPSCLVSLVMYSPKMNRSPVPVTVTHGGEPLELVVTQSYRNHQVSIYRGTGLTVEAADLVVTATNGDPITPIVGRITDLEAAPVIQKMGYQRGRRDSFSVNLDSPVSVMGKAVMASDTWFNLVGNSGQNLVTNRRISVGDVIPFVPEKIGTGWEVTEDGYKHTGPVSPLKGPIDGDPLNHNGVEMEITIGEGSSVGIYISNNAGTAYYTTLVGPMSDTVHETLQPGSVGVAVDLEFRAIGDVTIKNLKVKRDMIAMSVAMLHTDNPVVGQGFTVDTIISPANYCDLTAIAFSNEE